MSRRLLAIDVGGTKIEAVATDIDGLSLGRVITATDNSGPDGLLSSIENAIQQLRHDANLSQSDIAAVGLGVPGQVQPESGMVRMAVNLNVTAYPLARVLSDRLHAPVQVENDVRLAALGLYHHLNNNQPLHSLAYVSVGTGVAAGVVLQGRLLRGANGMAGEIGHAVFDPHGDPCLCGLRGCLETIISGPAIERQAQAWPHPAHTTQAGLPPGAAGVYAAYASGNPHARTLVTHVSSYLARALHWLVMSYDVERVVVGGGVAAAGAPFWQPILTELEAMRQASALAERLLSPGRFTLLGGNENPGIWGAIALAQQAAGYVHPIM